MSSAVMDNVALHRFELRQDGETAFLLYQREGSSIELIHTEVPEGLQGKGVGSKLVGGALHLIREQKLTVVPLCPFVIDYLGRHHEYLDILAPQYRRQIHGSE
jgi:uncharacterized protein